MIRHSRNSYPSTACVEHPQSRAFRLRTRASCRHRVGHGLGEQSQHRPADRGRPRHRLPLATDPRPAPLQAGADAGRQDGLAGCGVTGGGIDTGGSGGSGRGAAGTSARTAATSARTRSRTVVLRLSATARPTAAANSAPRACFRASATTAGTASLGRPAVTRTNRSSRKAGERDGTVQFVGPGEFGEQAGEPAAVEEAGDGVQQKRFGGAGRADEKDVFTGHQGGRQVAAGLGELVADRVGGRVGRG